MSYVPITLEEFKGLFPAFETLTEGSYDAWATRAEKQVGEAYGDRQQEATELLTAHLLALNGVGLSAVAAMLAATGATSFKSGTFNATISDAVVGQRAKGGYGSTSYGQQFQAIQRSIFGGPLLVGPIC